MQQRPSELKQGSDAIAYTATMDMSGVANATIVTQSLVLNNGAQESVNVNFNGVGDQLPLSGSTSVNEIVLNVTLSTFGNDLIPQGTYTDTITATISMN